MCSHALNFIYRIASHQSNTTTFIYSRLFGCLSLQLIFGFSLGLAVDGHIGVLEQSNTSFVPSSNFVGFKQDYKKTTEQISMKLGWRMGLGPTIGPSKFSCRSGNTVHVMVGNTDGKHDHLKTHDSRLRTRSEEHVTHSDPTQAINKYHNP